VKSSDLLIEHQCPQCGAPATLAEVDRLFTCAFCRVRSYLHAAGSLRYALPHKAPAGAEIVYAPYWRFKGMHFACLPEGIRHRFFDVSLSAVDAPQLPVSLGLRSQGLKLRFVSPEMPGRFLDPQRQPSTARQEFAHQLAADLPSPVLHQALVGEVLSLIYAPYGNRGGRLVDAVLDRPLSAAPAGGLADRPGGPPRWRLGFLATLCPTCGWDLDGARDAQALMCRRCGTLQAAGAQGWEPLPCATLDLPTPAPVFLPFWRIQADVAGVPLASYADLVRLANLPRAPRPEWADRPFHFWSPAFKVRPATFLRLARSVTLACPEAPLAAGLPPGEAVSVNLPLQEGLDTLKVCLAGFMRPPGLLRERLESIRITPRKGLLVFIPFENRPHELVQPHLHLALSKAQLALAGNL
jgi:predicted RNA-binding Zn-ribbon protein involved in translation (DUF1610 family)